MTTRTQWEETSIARTDTGGVELRREMRDAVKISDLIARLEYVLRTMGDLEVLKKVTDQDPETMIVDDQVDLLFEVNETFGVTDDPRVFSGHKTYVDGKLVGSQGQLAGRYLVIQVSPS